MQKLNDLSRSLIALEPASTLIAVIEMSLSSWLIGGIDAVGMKDGKGMTATLFAKGGDEYVRVSTSVPKPDGSGRAVGTVLAGPALESIKVGKSYYGEVPILGTPYITGYEPIMDSSGAQIGVYYVGYKK
jgi:hypothetical protein